MLVTNSQGAGVSPVATLTVNPGPEIVSSPGPQTVVVGTTVTLSVTAIGTTPLIYQWVKDNVFLSDGPNISGTTTAQLTVTNAQTTDTGKYAVHVTNNYAGEVSKQSTVVVYDYE